jgi:hypothetical protein
MAMSKMSQHHLGDTIIFVIVEEAVGGDWTDRLVLPTGRSALVVLLFAAGYFFSGSLAEHTNHSNQQQALDAVQESL